MILIESLVLGLKGISYSASQALEEEEEKLSDTTLALTMLAGIGLAVVLFAVLPVLIVRRLDFGIQHAWVSVLLEGIIRILIFLLYLIIISRYKDFQRIFQYHGAEHKTVYTFEAGRPLTVEEARGYSCLHPRCGTAFLLFVLVISIFIFSLLGKPGILLRITSRILLLPVIAGLSYEVIRWAGKNRDSKVVHWITLPGLWLQKLTTREPTDDQIEVAIAALNAAISVKEGSLTSVE